MPLLALIFDLILGEPPVKFHPTVWIGDLISHLEDKLYSQGGINSKIHGVILVIVVITATGTIAYLIQSMVSLFLSGATNMIVTSLLASTTIAFRSLVKHTRPILKALCSHDLKTARAELGMIVGRDTSHLTRGEVSRAAVEAIAESLGDGIVSPLFWFALFGLPGAFIYRAINTMDSMLGYKSEKYINFGWAAARTDDVANYIPARLIAFPSIVLAALISGIFRNTKELIHHTFKFQGKHLSPNAGWLEAPTARALSVSLGGVNYYKERKVCYPQLNPDGETAHPRHIIQCIKLITIAAFISPALMLPLLIIWR